MNISWDAENYTENFSFVHKYGEDVLSLITPIKNASEDKPTAVDLGCGNGRLTKKLSDRGFSVIGIDDSREMLDIAKDFYPELKFEKANALDFELEQKADVIFSNAVFHWIDEANQKRLAENLFSQLKSGGELVCEFGGKGCAESVHSALEKAFARHGRVYPRTFYFPTIAEYSAVLEDAGFLVREAFLFDRPTPQEGDDGLKNWICMFVKKPFEDMGKDEAEEILNETCQDLESKLFHDGKWFVDYVRIRIKAGKS